MASISKFLTAGLLVAGAAAHPHGHSHAHKSTVQKRSGTSTKRGAAYNDATLVSALTDSSSVISWAYNWGSTINGDIPSGVEYVPMLWGSSSTYTDYWTAAVKTALADGSTHLMGFNEPDSSSQSDISYSDAATYYKEYLTIYSSEATLVSPAVTSSTSDGEGLSWMTSFLSECTDCEISVLAVHWYGGDIAELKTFVNEAITVAEEYSISEVWVTEFGLDTDESGITDLATAATFVQEASEWLESKSAVARYSFFYCANDYMLTDSVANSVGNAYISVSGSSSSSSSSSSSESSSSSSESSTSTTESASSSTTTFVVAASTSTSVSVSTETISSSETEVSSSVSISIDVGVEAAEVESSSSSEVVEVAEATSSAAPTTSATPTSIETTSYSTSTVTLTAYTTVEATSSSTPTPTPTPVTSSTPTPTPVTSSTPKVTPSTPAVVVTVTPTVTVTEWETLMPTPGDFGACGAPKPLHSSH